MALVPTFSQCILCLCSRCKSPGLLPKAFAVDFLAFQARQGGNLQEVQRHHVLGQLLCQLTRQVLSSYPAVDQKSNLSQSRTANDTCTIQGSSKPYLPRHKRLFVLCRLNHCRFPAEERQSGLDLCQLYPHAVELDLTTVSPSRTRQARSGKYQYRSYSVILTTSSLKEASR